MAPQDPNKLGSDSKPSSGTDSDISEVEWDEGLAFAFGEPDPFDSRPTEVTSSGALNARVRILESRDDATSGDGAYGGARFGRYVASEEIARGGVGVILRGEDPDIGRTVAIKVLRDEFLASPGLVRRFVEEAQIGGQLQHPGIVPVYDMGLDERHRPYFAMKLVQGRTLKELLAERSDPREERQRFLVIFEKICQTVAHAHSRGVVHRDLKPANVMVGAFGEVQLMDWGFAKLLDQKEETVPGDGAPRTLRAERGDLSEVGSVLGTPAYMSPEQAAGAIDRLDRRSDVFSLGAILCEILRGKPPYGPGDGDTLALARKAELRPVFDELASHDIEDGLLGILRSCLAADPEERLDDARTLARSVSGYLESQDDRAHKAILEAAEARGRAREERRARQLSFALLAAVVLIAAGGIFGALWWQNRRIERRNEARSAYATARDLFERREWSAAQEAVIRARGAADAAGLDEIRGELETLAGGIDRGARSETLAGALEATRALPGELSDDAIAAYRQAFTNLDPRLQTPDATHADLLSEQLDETALRGVARALDDWFLRVGDPEESERKARQGLLELANVLDPEPLRTELRSVLLKDDAAALRSLAEGSEADPENAEAVASALSYRGESEEARKLLRAAWRRHPDDWWVNYRLGQQLAKASPDEAWQHAVAAVSLRPHDARSRGQLAALSASEDHYQDAVRELQRAMADAPEWSKGPAAYQLMKLYIDRGKTEEARALVSEMEKREGEDELTRWGLRERWNRSRRRQGSRSAWMLLPPHPDDLAKLQKRGLRPRDRRFLIWMLYDMGRFEEALGAIPPRGGRPQRRPGPPHDLEVRARLLLRLGRYADVQQLLAAGMEGHPPLIDLNGRAKALGAIEERFSTLELTSLPKDADELASVAWVAMAKGEWEIAARALARLPRGRRMGGRPGTMGPRDVAAIMMNAGLGRGPRAAQVGDDERQRWRLIGRRLLERELGGLSLGFERSGLGPRAYELACWLYDVRLAPLRSEDELSRLPADEAQRWREVWKRLEKVCVYKPERLEQVLKLRGAGPRGRRGRRSEGEFPGPREGR